MRVVDGKFHIDGERIVKTASGETVPEEEPLFLIRARDYLAIPLLAHYRQLCIADGCNEFQLSLLDSATAKFVRFSNQHPEQMKQPGVTRGMPWIPNRRSD